MRSGPLVWILAGLIGGIWLPWSRVPEASAKIVASVPAETCEADHSTPTTTLISFESDIQPILSARCQPCHFPGGIMYQQLPFDRGETVHKLGTKLFTRIKDEKEQARVRAFLAQAR
jgi:hypothetical protein